KHGNKNFYEKNRVYSDTDLFSILTIPFIMGNPETALDRPATVVITNRMTKKYFKSENPLGKTIVINTREYEITGIVEDPPTNTHFKHDFIVSLKTLEGRYPFDAWFLSNFYTYIKLKPNVDISNFSEQLKHVAEIYAKEKLEDGDEKVSYFLQPVPDIHLHSHLQSEMAPAIHPIYLTIFSIVGLFVLLIACFNFINLNTARSAKRAKEVGMRKVIGAGRGQLIWQFLGESFVIILFAVLLALIVIELSLPLLNELTTKNFTTSNILQPKIFVVLFCLVLFVTIFASGYPSFFLSGFQPIKTIKSSVDISSGGSGLRMILVVGQFAISVFLIIGTIIVYQQLSFMKNQYLGFDKEQKLILPIRGPISIRDNYELLKSEFLKHNSITGVTVSSEVPGERSDRWDTRVIGSGDNRYHEMNYYYIDYDYIKQYGMTLLSGRSFEKGRATDIEGPYIINRTAAKELNWSNPDDAIGKRIEAIYEGEIIGVVEDFHYQGLQSIVEPLVLQFIPSRFDEITLNIKIENLAETITFALTKWKELFPDIPFEYFFLDTAFNQQYQSEERIGKIFSALTFLGLFIACLGLFGLASFITEQKTKEIGIRKVLGATVSGIIFLLSKEFVKWILVANIIALPLTFFVMKSWLQSFAYRTEIEIWIFLLSAVVTLMIALITVSYQSIKAALINAVESLRYE
ncbi:MAG: ABC transporter permease, partial [bacterium]